VSFSTFGDLALEVKVPGGSLGAAPGGRESVVGTDLEIELRRSDGKRIRAGKL